MITYKRHISIKLLRKEKGDYRVEEYLPKRKLLYSSAVRLGLLDVIDCLKFTNNEHVLLPPICPQGLLIPFERKKVDFKYYHLAEDFTVHIGMLEQMLANDKCKVLVFIHYFGIFNPQVAEIKKLCDQHNVILIEDAVQGLFSKDENGQKVGSVGDIALFSLPKFLPVPDGAIFVINNPGLKVEFNYRKSQKMTLSRLFHLQSLLLNSLISETSNKYIYRIIKAFSLLNYSAYYFFLFLNKHNQNISKTSLRILSNIEYEEYIKRRNIIYDYYNTNLYNYKLNQQVPNLSGYPLKIKAEEKNSIKQAFYENGIETISYTKGWNYIPDSGEYDFERHLISQHLLLPMNAEIPLTVYEQKIHIIKKILNL